MTAKKVKAAKKKVINEEIDRWSKEVTATYKAKVACCIAKRLLKPKKLH